MKTLKLIDLFIQAILIGGGFFYAVFESRGNGSFLYPYYLVGGWQLLGFGIHLLMNNGLLLRNERKQYGMTNLWMFVAGIILLALAYAGLSLIIFFLFALLFVGPVMAIWYFSICLREMKLIKSKELVHLK